MPATTVKKTTNREPCVSDPVAIVIPIYNDWESVTLLLKNILHETSNQKRRYDVILVDDGSSLKTPDHWNLGLGSINSVSILRLRRNLGHQRAICIALCHLCELKKHDQVVVMDGDGEDAPSDIKRLLDELDQNQSVGIVFAERKKRSEGPLFSAFYLVYRIIHRALIGHRVRVGNFSAMQRRCLESICVASELWNHFAASVFITRQPMALIPTNRNHRLAGKSKMNFPALVNHGLSAFSVFAGILSTRLLIFCMGCMSICAVAIQSVIAIRLATNLAVPGWATVAFGISLLSLIQIATFVATFNFQVLSNRGQAPFIPIRDYKIFIDSNTQCWSQ